MTRLLVSCALLVAAAAPARAETKPQLPALEGATVVATYKSDAAFIDDPVAGDATRIAYFASDASASAQLHVVTIADGSEQVAELAPITTHPVAVELVGPRAFVVGVQEDGTEVAALVELVATKTKPAGTAVYKLGPAAAITAITRDGKRRVAVHRTTTTKIGTRHDVDLLAIETGQRVAAGHPVEVDANNASAALDFRVNHWSDGFTRAYGIKGGEWNRKEDQRSPDVEASYDLITGKFETKPITDLLEQRKRYQALADAKAGQDFVRMSWDLQNVQIWSGGKSHDAKLPAGTTIVAYDPKSLQGTVLPDGSAWFALKVDPVNVEAVARKKRDPEYLDVFRAAPDGTTTRVARVLAVGSRHRLGVIGDRFWLIERNNGFERGGKTLTLYSVTAQP